MNADSAAAAVATALGAESLLFLTDVPGFLDSDGNVVPSLHAHAAQTLIANGAVSGGMRPKLEAAIDALHSGVARVVITGPEHHSRAFASSTGGTHLVAA